MSEALVIAPPGALKQDSMQALQWTLVTPGDSEVRVCSGVDALAEQCQARPVILVLSAADAMVASVTLAKKQAKHIARVVPFLLEDQLLVTPESQWFAWGAPEQGQYPVVAVDRSGLQTLLKSLSAAGIDVRGTRVDAAELTPLAPARFSLGAERELVISASGTAMVLEHSHAQALIGEDAPLGEMPEAADLDDYRAALQASLQNKARVELLHGDLRVRPRKSSKAAPRLDGAWRSFTLFMAASSVVALCLVAFQGYQYQSAAGDMRAQAAATYEDLFPGDKATARLESQFNNRIKLAGGGGAGQGGFLGLMTPVGEALASKRSDGLQARSIQFSDRDGMLVMELSAPDFETLQALKAALEEAGLGADIANYRNQGKQVTALLKVSS